MNDYVVRSRPCLSRRVNALNSHSKKSSGRSWARLVHASASKFVAYPELALTTASTIAGSRLKVPTDATTIAEKEGYEDILRRALVIDVSTFDNSSLWVSRGFSCVSL
jgi:hypothetical protein